MQPARLVIAVAAVQDVLPALTFQQVIAAEAIKRVISVIPPEPIAVRIAGYGVRPVGTPHILDIDVDISIIRAADAAGADAVVLTGRTVDPYNPKVVRSTTGSLFHLPIAVGGELADVVERAHAAGITVLAADVKGDDLLAARADGVLARPTGWLFGNEAHGLEDHALGLADRVLRLPIFGRAESLNLATAASVCLYESAFAQRA